jgi:ABC-type multidrug transport system fused ATPase/permease subunit
MHNKNTMKQQNINICYAFWIQLTSIFYESTFTSCECGLSDGKCINCGKNDNIIYHKTLSYCDDRRKCIHCGLCKNRFVTYTTYDTRDNRLYQRTYCINDQENFKCFLHLKTFLMIIYLFILSILMLPCFLINFIFGFVHMIIYRVYLRIFATKRSNCYKNRDSNDLIDLFTYFFPEQTCTMNIFNKIIYCGSCILNNTYNESLSKVSKDYDDESSIIIVSSLGFFIVCIFLSIMLNISFYISLLVFIFLITIYDHRIIVYLFELCCVTISKIPQLLLMTVICVTTYIYIIIIVFLYINIIKKLCYPFFGNIPDNYCHPLFTKIINQSDKNYNKYDEYITNNDVILLNDINILHIIFRIITVPVVVLFGYFMGIINIILITFCGSFIQINNKYLVDFEQILFYQTQIIYNPILKYFSRFCNCIAMLLKTSIVNIYNMIKMLLYTILCKPILCVVNIARIEINYVLMILMNTFVKICNKIENM